MLNKSLYPKTKRIGSNSKDVIITEKLDGSNLGIFKVNNELLIAQRNWIFKLSELNKENAYKGLISWLEENKDYLLEQLHDNAGVFGEWIGMGRLKYGETLNNIKFHIFAKANYNVEEDEIKNLYYNRELFIYPFKNQEIPPFMNVVPLVNKGNEYPTIDMLDKIYDDYCIEVDRDVEGFIVSQNNAITKYVRNKNGTLIPHTNKGE